MSKKIDTATEGEWISPRRKNFTLECCDCGLAHTMNFRLVPTPNGGKRIQFQGFRKNRSTGQNRRHAGITLTRKT